MIQCGLSLDPAVSSGVSHCTRGDGYDGHNSRHECDHGYNGTESLNSISHQNQYTLQYLSTFAASSVSQGDQKQQYLQQDVAANGDEESPVAMTDGDDHHHEAKIDIRQMHEESSRKRKRSSRSRR